MRQFRHFMQYLAISSLLSFPQSGQLFWSGVQMTAILGCQLALHFSTDSYLFVFVSLFKLLGRRRIKNTFVHHENVSQENNFSFFQHLLELLHTDQLSGVFLFFLPFYIVDFSFCSVQLCPRMHKYYFEKANTGDIVMNDLFRLFSPRLSSEQNCHSALPVYHLTHFR